MRTSYVVVPESSAVLVEARSSVGIINFATMTLSGRVDVAVTGGGLQTEPAPSARLELPVSSLTSGNPLYDAELRRRLNAQLCPIITAELTGSQPLGADRFAVEGDLTIHGTTRRLSGSLQVTFEDAERLLVEGAQTVDIRDFDIGLPTMLMLRIYPDVLVRYRIEGRLAQTG